MSNALSQRGYEIEQTRGWPVDVRPISVEDLDNLGIDSSGMLHWAGRPMIIQQTLTLTPWQKAAVLVVVLFAIAGGLESIARGVGAVADYGCSTQLFAKWCAASPH